MLKIMRKKMKLIIWAMVIAFCSTMFIGTLYFNLSGKKTRMGTKNPTNTPKDFRGEIAVIGNLPVNKMKFTEVLNRFIEEMTRKDPTMRFIDPELLEYIRYNAYNQALQFTILLEEAKKRGIKAKRGEVNDNIKSILIMQNIKDKGQLKDLLKKNNYPYDLFIANLKNNIIVQKLIKKIQEETVVTDQDIIDSFKKIHAEHILIKINEDKKGKKLDKEAQKKADDVYNEIQKGLSFEKAAEKYSDDITKTRGGDLGWFGKGMMVPEFETMAFSLKKGEISKPFKTMYGYHILKVIDIKNEKPQNVNNDKLKKQLEEAQRKQNYEQIISKAMQNNKIEIFDNQLLAYRYKMKGELEKAVNEYRAMIAENPISPMPHYMAGKVLEMKGDLEGAKSELEKAKVKQSMNKEYSFGEINIALGNIYKKEGNNSKALAEYELASTSSNDRASVHEELAGIYRKMGLIGKANQEAFKVQELGKKKQVEKQKIMDAIKNLKENAKKEEKKPETSTKNK